MVRSAARRPSFSLSSSSPTLFHPDPGSTTISLLSFRFFLPPRRPPPPLPSVSILSRRSRRDNETRKRRFANEREEEKEKFSGRDYDRWCNATVNREWKWASRDFRRIKIIIRRKRVEWVKTGRLNGKESVGSRSAIRGTPLLPANRRENTWSSVPRNIYKGYI